MSKEILESFENLPQIITPDDSGNIEILECKSNKISLNIRKDTYSETFHWFYFELKGKTDETYSMHLLNADKSPFPCWKGDYQDFPYAAVASYDGQSWFRVKTKFEKNQLVMQITLKKSNIFFATFAPYPYSKHKLFLQELKNCKVTTIGESGEKRPISLITMGAADLDRLFVLIKSIS